MPRIFSVVVFLFFSCAIRAQTVSNSQNSTPLDTSILKYKTIEEVLGLPSAYKVVSNCVLIYTSKGEIFKMEIRSWQADIARIRTFVLRGKKGDQLIIDDIMVEKGGVKKKLMPKTFTF